jgi:hypothetical protein
MVKRKQKGRCRKSAGDEGRISNQSSRSEEGKRVEMELTR